MKDDSGGYTFFTEQGSSASQMTAAKIMDVTWTSSWCSICLHSSKIGGCSQIPQNSQIRMSRCLDASSTTQMAKIIEENLKIPRYLLNETCMVILYPDCCGKGNLKKRYENLDGRKFRTGNVCSFIGNKGDFCQYMWTTSK